MRLMQSVGEVGDAINLAKAKGGSFCTNFFAAPQKLQRWITHRELFVEETQGAVFLFRRDRDLWHLYFCAPDQASLQRAIDTQIELRSEPVVIDLVGRDVVVECTAKQFEAAGFRQYKRLFRMSRSAHAVTAIPSEAEDRMVFASEAQSQAIVAMLLTAFDFRAEQIPTTYEVESAAKRGQILLAYSAEMLAGVLYFETRGLTSTLRYWVVVDAYRGRGLGSILIHRYFSLHPVVRRFILWVAADNRAAIDRYERYGFVPDGLVDQVLTNEMVTS